jgi:hypothetical protein
LPMSSAATRSMISSLSCVVVSISASSRDRGGRCPQEPGAQVEKSNPRDQRHTERPAKRLPAPGLEPTSAIKQLAASAESAHPDFPPGTGIPPGISGA